MIALLRRGAPDEVSALREQVRRHFRVGDSEGAPEVSVVDTIENAPKTLVLPWVRRQTAIAPLTAALRARLRGRQVRWVDLDGAHGKCGLGFFLAQGFRAASFAVLDVATRVLATAIRWLVPPSTKPDTRDEAATPWIVLPVLPDLSHTFVYREAAKLLELEPSFRLLVLEHGTAAAPTHSEARALLERAEFLPMRGIVRRYAGTIGWLLRAPRRASRLLRAYAADGHPHGLFGKLPLRDPRHPGRGFDLASFWRAQPQPLGPVHVYSSTYATNVTHAATRLLGSRFSLTSYVDFDFEYDHRMLDQKLADTDFFRVCTTYCQTRVRELTPAAADQVPVILFGLDLDAWGDQSQPTGEGELFSACRLVPKKGLHLMPPALAELAREGVEFRWRIAGDGPERERIERLVREHGLTDRVEFLGGVSTDTVSKYLRRADLAVLPCVVAADGERDGIPIFFNEAMALGVAVVSTPVSGIPEMVRDGETGFLAKPDDVASLTKTLRRALSDDSARARIAAAGRAEVRRRLDLNHAANQLLERIHGR